ncbi:hypothetical protein CMO83_04710 [Candidatus Woesearchaeota archaeon]|jgi:hypothetical protein|nr:hypothetical protein [Candidatus Woesearchaeota archaeon]
MNIFKDITLKWWQGSIFKLTMMAFGVAVGTTWPAIFSSWTTVLWIIFVVGAIYLATVWFKQ